MTNKEQCEEVLQRMFKDSWEIKNEEIVIRIKDLTIRNSKQKSHVIDDIFVKIKVNESMKFKTAGLEGFRSIFKIKDFSSSYAHSHLPGSCVRNSMDFKSFCLGTGPINTIIMKLVAKFDITSFTFFLHQLKVYLGWESLEGRPYKLMSGIKLKLDHSSSRSISVLDFLLDDVILMSKSMRFNILLSENEVKILRDSTFYENVKNYIVSNEIPNCMFLFKDGKYSNDDVLVGDGLGYDTIDNDFIKIRNKDKFIFRDEEIRISFSDYKLGENNKKLGVEDREEKIVHHKVLDKIEEHLNTLLINYYEKNNKRIAEKTRDYRFKKVIV